MIIAAEGRRRADLRVRDGRIAEISEPAGAREPLADPDVDGAGLWLLPGGVDAHVHFGMPLRDGLESRGWRASSTAALLGGTTTVIDFANPRKGESLEAAVSLWRDRADRDCLCDYGLHVTVAEVDAPRLAEIPGLVASGLPTFKAFLAYKDRLMLVPAELARLMAAVRAAGGALWLHAEDGELNASLEADLIGRGMTAPQFHPSAHPAESEISAIETALEAADQTGCPLTIVHLSTGAGLSRIVEARAEGVDVRAEVCIQHLFRNADVYRVGMDPEAILSPPLRPEADTRALRAALSDPTIVQISTDHCEFPPEIKIAEASDGFAAIPNGAAGVGERLIVSYTLGVLPGLIAPERWVDLCCTRPAAHAGLGGRKGRIAAGMDADLVLFDPDARNTVLPQNAEASLWTGDHWRGRVVDVWRRGIRVVRNGRLQDGIAPGRFLERGDAPEN